MVSKLLATSISVDSLGLDVGATSCRTSEILQQLRVIWRGLCYIEGEEGLPRVCRACEVHLRCSRYVVLGGDRQYRDIN